MRVLIALLFLVPAVAWADPPTIMGVGDSQTYWTSGASSYLNLYPKHFQMVHELTSGGANCSDKVSDFTTWLASNDCPDVVTLMCGTNDCAVGASACDTAPHIAAVVAQVEAFVALVEAEGSTAIVLTPPPLHSLYCDTPDVPTGCLTTDDITYMGDFAAAEVASGAANGYTVIDIWQAMTDYGNVAGQDTDDLIVGSTDLIHLNSAGDAFVASVVNPYLEALYEPPNPNILY